MSQLIYVSEGLHTTMIAWIRNPVRATFLDVRIPRFIMVSLSWESTVLAYCVTWERVTPCGSLYQK